MTENPTKVQIFNVVILDKSGSMGNMRKAAVDGFNETLNGIKQSQQQYKDTQDHFITLTLFCDCGIENVYDKVSVKDVPELTMEDFEPCCNTPLMDAIGKTLTDVENHVKDIDDSLVVVTIITDGHENSSKQYNNAQVRTLIDRLKEKSWSFTFIGANQDSFAVARRLSITQARNFDATPLAMSSVQNEIRAQNSNLFSNIHSFKKAEVRSPAPMAPAQRSAMYSHFSSNAYASVPNTSSSRPLMPPQFPSHVLPGTRRGGLNNLSNIPFLVTSNNPPFPSPFSNSAPTDFHPPNVPPPNASTFTTTGTLSNPFSSPDPSSSTNSTTTAPFSNPSSSGESF